MRSNRSSHARHRMPLAAAYRMRRRLSARCPESLQAGIATLRHRSAISAMRAGVVESFGGLTQPNRVKSGSEAADARREPAAACARGEPDEASGEPDEASDEPNEASDAPGEASGAPDEASGAPAAASERGTGAPAPAPVTDAAAYGACSGAAADAPDSTAAPPVA